MNLLVDLSGWVCWERVGLLAGIVGCVGSKKKSFTSHEQIAWTRHLVDWLGKWLAFWSAGLLLVKRNGSFIRLENITSPVELKEWQATFV
jgi:hypothetical protein